ncbi:MAG: hypothetical protein SPK64_03215 [Candidatus Enterosoma sp.]|nr:hypothetical protein [Candidatus Enterosoma sp.]
MKTKKRLSVKQWAFIYSLIIIVSIILISTLLAFFITSNIKNKQLKRYYQEQYQHIQEIIEDEELNNDQDYGKSKEDDLLNEHPSEEVIFVKKV